MTKRATTPGFKASYAGFKKGVIDDTSVNSLTFGRASGRVAAKGAQDRAKVSGQSQFGAKSKSAKGVGTRNGKRAVA